MRKNPPRALVSTEYNTEELKKLTSGGSTGEPFSVYINSKEDAWRKAIYLRANIRCGQRPRDLWASVIDSQYSDGSNKLQKTLGLFFRQIVPITMNRHSRLKTVEDINPDVLDGFPSALHLLAKDQEQTGEKKIQPRIIFGSGELIDKNSVSSLEKAFGAPYFDQYGCTEIDRSAWQCERHLGYHMDVDSVIIQFVDEDGEEVCPGEKGEIVYTSLFNYVFPIIRYNIEDVGVPIEDECLCDVNLPMMEVIEGRSNDTLIFPDNQVFTPIRFIEILGAFKLEEEIEQYRIIQKKRNLVRIILKKVNEKVAEAEVELVLRKNLLRLFPRNSSKHKGTVHFEIDFVEELPLTLRGKLNVVTSEL